MTRKRHKRALKIQTTANGHHDHPIGVYVDTYGLTCTLTTDRVLKAKETSEK